MSGEWGHLLSEKKITSWLNSVLVNMHACAWAPRRFLQYIMGMSATQVNHREYVETFGSFRDYFSSLDVVITLSLWREGILCLCRFVYHLRKLTISVFCPSIRTMSMSCHVNAMHYRVLASLETLPWNLVYWCISAPKTNSMETGWDRITFSALFLKDYPSSLKNHIFAY